MSSDCQVVEVVLVNNCLGNNGEWDFGMLLSGEDIVEKKSLMSAVMNRAPLVEMVLFKRSLAVIMSHVLVATLPG